MSDSSGNIHEFTVSELSFSLKKTVEENYPYVRVRGELGRVSRPASGHVYLDLKDDKAVINGVIWKGVAAGMKLRPEQGLEVIVTGKLTTFPGQSRYQIIIERMEPAGVGALMALLEERRKKLAAEGLFDETRKQEIPFLPGIIGVVTSPSGAVIRDIIHRVSDRFPTRVIVWPVRVQGESCAAEVAAAIAGFNNLTPGGAVPRPDVIIVARGGGSLEDLWGFNEEAVVRAAAASKIPLISAVGHETDWTLIDHAADERAPTPTAAAERAVPVRADLIFTLEDLTRRQHQAARRQLQDKRNAVISAGRALPKPAELLALARQRLDAVAERNGLAIRRAHQDLSAALQAANLAMPKMSEVVARARQRYETIAARGRQTLKAGLMMHRAHFERITGQLSPGMILRRIGEARRRNNELMGRGHGAVRRRSGEARRHLSAAGQLLTSLGYVNVLGRGFALVRDNAGQVVRSTKAAPAGTALDIELADGHVPAIAGKGGKGGKAPKGAGKPAPKPDGEDQGNLF